MAGLRRFGLHFLERDVLGPIFEGLLHFGTGGCLRILLILSKIALESPASKSKRAVRKIRTARRG